LKPQPEEKTEPKVIGAKSLNIDQNETVKSYNFRKGPTKCAEPEGKSNLRLTISDILI